MITLIAQLSNPAVQGIPEYTGNSGVTGAAILGQYLGIAISTAISLGALALLVYFTIGAINWITAGGDSGKISDARNKIINAFVGFALLFFMIAILMFADNYIFKEVSLLRIEFINQLGSGNATTDYLNNLSPQDQMQLNTRQ